MLEQHEGNVERLPKRVSKNRDKTLPSYMVFSLTRVVDNVVLLQKLSQSKEASRCMIIKLANIHERAQYLYEGNQKGDRWG